MARPTVAITAHPRPGVQTSAAINEFKCLFTHDKRQKRKRWKDGLLRFHTFNKRIMVYDEPQNFVGDMHWRSEDPVAEGDELEFDTFLVEIQEALCTVQQDLTGIHKSLDARRAERQLDPHRVQHQITLTQKGFSSNAMDQARVDRLAARPLSSVLAANRGPIGRSSMQQLSPYEQREARILQEGDETPQPKRRKITRPDPVDLSSSPGFEDGHLARRHIAPSLQSAMARRRANANRQAAPLSSPIHIPSTSTPTRSLEDDLSQVITRPRRASPPPPLPPPPRRVTVQGTLSRRFDNASSRAGPKLLCGPRTPGPIAQRNIFGPASDCEDDDGIGDAPVDDEAAEFDRKQREKMDSRLKRLDKGGGVVGTVAGKKGKARKPVRRKVVEDDDEDDVGRAPAAEDIEVISLDDDSLMPAPAIQLPAFGRAPIPNNPSGLRRNKQSDPLPPPQNIFDDDPMDDYIEADYALPPTAAASTVLATKTKRVPQPTRPRPRLPVKPAARTSAPRQALTNQDPNRDRAPSGFQGGETSSASLATATKPSPFLREAAKGKSKARAEGKDEGKARAKAITNEDERRNAETTAAGADDDAASRNANQEPSAEDEDLGPWSREAYDLFGDWRPPGREIGGLAG